MKSHKSAPTIAPLSAGDEIFWQESADICRPIPCPLSDFLSGVQLASHHSLLPPLPSGKEDEPLLVFLEEGCMKQMQDHASHDILREQAGILCGQTYVDAGQNYVNITSALAAETVSDAAHFKFHKDCWEKIWRQLENGHDILGWYHTHPGLGVFLSSTDLRTQQLQFCTPWSVAVVIDPVTRETGIFAGRKGTRVREKSCFFYRSAEAKGMSEDTAPASGRV
jgi:26S proteasome regulatory subunit N11